jgi:hypothetical protein
MARAALSKSPDQKTTNRLQAPSYKAFSRLHPRYSQPAPQQTGTSQNCGKTGVCSVYMSRFGSLVDLFSTIAELTHFPCRSEPARDSGFPADITGD